MKTRSLKFLLLINGKIPCTCIHVNNYLSVTMGDYGKLHYKSFSVESDVNELKENQEANRRKIESIYSIYRFELVLIQDIDISLQLIGRLHIFVRIACTNCYFYAFGTLSNVFP